MEGIVDVGAFSLDPAAVVRMEARDAKTGAGIEGVRFQYETDEGVLRFQSDNDWNHRRQELRRSPLTADYPETDEQGRFWAILEPGRKRFFVGTVPSGWKLEGPARRPFIAVAGRELTIRWTFTRVEDSKAADAFAYAGGIPSRQRWSAPVKVGQPAPPIEPAAWVDRAGRTDPPDVVGKVVLVHFWAISCFGCRTDLPEVQAAAKHFADEGEGLVIIGLHEVGAAPDQVARLARERGLTYRLAVDRPAAEEDAWFGETFRDYGVRGTHTAAVIDRKGHVAFVGRFPEALKEAAKLLGP
jgi:thiol-disulfide isomerase/thioredoxin